MPNERFEPRVVDSGKLPIPEFDAEHNEYTLALPGSMQRIEPHTPTEPIQVRVLVPENLQQQSEMTVVLHLHGSYHSSEEEQSLLDACRESDAVVVSVTTSRRMKVDFADIALKALSSGKDPITELLSTYKANFAGKGYPEERDDFAQGLQVGMQSVVEPLRKQRPLHIMMLGVSLGGRIAADLSATIRPEKLLLYAPVLNLDEKERLVNPLSHNSSDPADVLASMQADQTVVIRGTADANISLEECQQYVDASQDARLIEIPGAQHEIFFDPASLNKLESIITEEVTPQS